MVRPEECTAASERVALEMRELEQRIDEALKEHYWDGGKECFVNINGVWEAAKRIHHWYKENGWNVVLTDDQKDGAFMTFSPRKSEETG